MKNQIHVRVLDEEFVLNTESSVEKVKRVESHLAALLQEISQKAKGIPPYKAVILAALNISEKYLDAVSELENIRSENAKFKAAVCEKSTKVLGLLDSNPITWS